MNAPEFIGSKQDWINSEPLRIAELKDKKVVLIDFWEYTCVNCIRTFPYLKEWHRRYKDKGLVIVGIHAPEFEFAKERGNVRRAAADFGLEFPVLIDAEYKNWQAYANSYWPHKYLVNKHGKIIYDHIGEGGYAETERKIQSALKELDSRLSFPPVMSVVRDSDKPGAVCYPVTHEMYAGRRGVLSGHFGHPDKFKVGAKDLFLLPPKIEHGRIYLNGEWIMEEEYFRVAPGAWGGAAAELVTIRYRAKECNAVIKPQAETGFKVFVLQDGKKLSRQDAGRDIRFDAQTPYLLIDKPRMYSITVNEKHGEHVLELIVASSSFSIYAFTFSSCEIKR